MKDIEVCLTSVLAETYPNCEVIFVDSNSADGSLECARKKFPKLKFVANNDNLGYG